MQKIISLLRNNKNNLFYFVASMVILFFLIEISYYAVFLDTWFDEPNFTYKSWLASQDLAYPFQDFRSKYPPVAFYSQMFFQGIFGPTILGARILSGLFLAGMLGLMFDIGRRLGNKWIGLLAAALLIFHPYLVGNFTAAVPYALGMFCSLLAVWLFCLPNMLIKRKIMLTAIAMSLAMLVRHNLFPAVIVLWIFVFFNWKSWKYLIVSILTSAAVILIAYFPYFMLDFEYALIWFFIMFGPLAKLLPFDYVHLPIQFVSGTPWIASLLSEARLKSFIGVFIKYFHLWVIFISALLLFSLQKRNEIKNFMRENSILVFIFIMTLALFAAHYLGPVRSNIIYSLYFAPFLALSTALAINKFYQYAVAKNIWQFMRKLLMVFLTVIILSSSVSIALSDSSIIFFNRFNYQDSDLKRAARGAEYLKLLTSRENIIFTIDDPQHVFLAGRYVIPPLINKHATYVDSNDSETLARYCFYNIEMLLSWLEAKADIVVMQKGTVEERVGIRMQSPDAVDKFNNILKENYELAGSIENVYPLKYTRGSGIMEVYKRK